MKFQDWKPFYKEIVREMRYDVDSDRKSAEILQDLLLKNRNYIKVSYLKEILKGQRAYVFGAGPSLELALRYLSFHDGVMISADGATSALLEFGLVPDIVVTDLDGCFEDIKRADVLGAYIVVHAHGDNIEKLKEYVPQLEKVLGTCQTEPLDIVYNFGGFTDGDRAVFLAEEFGAEEIILVGFDFGDVVGKWSKPHLKGHTRIWESKRKKFEFAQKLLEWLKKNGKAKIKRVVCHPIDNVMSECYIEG
ncbi:6-hydroxymethylpterin diphosphokinase MptE-like protein [Thermococcus sp.]